MNSKIYEKSGFSKITIHLVLLTNDLVLIACFHDILGEMG